MLKTFLKNMLCAALKHMYTFRLDFFCRLRLRSTPWWWVRTCGSWMWGAPWRGGCNAIRMYMLVSFCWRRCFPRGLLLLPVCFVFIQWHISFVHEFLPYTYLVLYRASILYTWGLSICNTNNQSAIKNENAGQPQVPAVSRRTPRWRYACSDVFWSLSAGYSGWTFQIGTELFCSCFYTLQKLCSLLNVTVFLSERRDDGGVSLFPRKKDDYRAIRVHIPIETSQCEELHL